MNWTDPTDTPPQVWQTGKRRRGYGKRPQAKKKYIIRFFCGREKADGEEKGRDKHNSMCRGGGVGGGDGAVRAYAPTARGAISSCRLDLPPSLPPRQAAWENRMG
eukprot:TRINITY_DN6056_c0_g1_i1.p3 TRINITY_DN6056_c0_g1~~TRINITY_DN6056_c0_g1_i1.p3  ORF type:complete len:105 (-),score=0.08 TRINITY_DN6056_c0_g1_i1:1244-1558(-)